ncbi:MAG: peptide deformylase [Actinobacteria bacterium]|nr:peptide deformylase [Actinomycetota bacterium]
MTKFSDISIAEKTYDIKISAPDFVENVDCKEMTVDDITEEHVDLTKRMLRFLTDINGLGLAAPQIGLQKRFFVYWDENVRPHVIYNAKYYPHQKKKESWVEKCLTYGDLQFGVSRYKYIAAVWWEYDPDSHELYKVMKKLLGQDAQVFQHETDHINSRTIALHGTVQGTN